MTNIEKCQHIIQELLKLNESANDIDIQKAFRKYPNEDSGLIKRSEVLFTYQKLKLEQQINISSIEEKKLLKLLKLKRIRTLSGVTPVTVLTKPYPCVGECIFCPNDVYMPKSYISNEPGAQRAFKNYFDPYLQVTNRLVAYKNIGHSTDKIELIILGGTFTSYTKDYQMWFVKRCFDALNSFDSRSEYDNSIVELPYIKSILEKESKKDLSYNKIVSKAINVSKSKLETCTKNELIESQKINETATTRCIGLVIETRPDQIDIETLTRLRLMGVTKIQIGIQSLNDTVLKLNKRNHTSKDSIDAINLIRQFGYKIHLHVMPNLYGSDTKKDIIDFKKVIKLLNPDELKIYPCSLIESTELINIYKKGLWKPYSYKELIGVLTKIIKLTPRYCRITRMIRDISSNDIVAGNKLTNVRQTIEANLIKEKTKINEIRFREIKEKKVKLSDLRLKVTKYTTGVSKEYFLEYITTDDAIAGFLRLSLPTVPSPIKELENSSIIREIHVYGEAIDIGKSKLGMAQHFGLGKSLIEKAKEISKDNGYEKMNVISSIGTKEYYRKNGFKDGDLYQKVKNCKYTSILTNLFLFDIIISSLLECLPRMWN